MGVLSNSAIIVLLLSIGTNVAPLSIQTILEIEPDLTSFDPLYQVTKLALPSLSNQSNMTSTEIVGFWGAMYKALNDKIKWEITVDVNGTLGNGENELRLVTFQTTHDLSGNCRPQGTYCVNNVQIIELRLPEADDGWENVPNLKDFDDVYQVARIALPTLETELDLSSIEILKFEHALGQKASATNWTITIDILGNPDLNSQKLKVNFQAVQQSESSCPDLVNICLDAVKVTSSKSIQ